MLDGDPLVPGPYGYWPRLQAWRVTLTPGSVSDCYRVTLIPVSVPDHCVTLCLLQVPCSGASSTTALQAIQPP